MGQIEGPFAAPTEWGVQTVDYRARASGRAEQLLPAPGDQECYAAFAFPTEQTGSDGQLKIRRGEDWARNGHNGMTLVEDSPVHYNVDHLVESADALVSGGLPEPVSWGQGVEEAYRMLHATPANVMYFILVTHTGATLWRNRVAMFGASRQFGRTIG